jgi:hypothetical protein
MPSDIRLALPKDLTPDKAAKMLKQAQDAYFDLLTGKMPSSVDTPQLGRVQFAQTTAADLQRLIDYLQGIVTGTGTDGSGLNVRKPISFFGWP